MCLHTCVCTHTEEISWESCVGKVAEAPGSHRQSWLDKKGCCGIVSYFELSRCSMYSKWEDALIPCFNTSQKEQWNNGLNHLFICLSHKLWLTLIRGQEYHHTLHPGLEGYNIAYLSSQPACHVDVLSLGILGAMLWVFDLKFVDDVNSRNKRSDTLMTSVVPLKSMPRDVLSAMAVTNHTGHWALEMRLVWIEMC